MMLSAMDRAKEKILDKAALDEKLIDIDSKYINLMIDWPKTKPLND